MLTIFYHRHRQVASNQYGLPGRKERNWGPDTVEGDLSEKELQNNRHDQPIDNARHRFRNEEYYANMSYNMGDIEVPLLSVGNWGGNSLHLRGNLEGYTNAGSEFKYLRMITGRHDLPFYQTEEVEIQLSFLNAFLKDDDPKGWTRKGTVAPVDIVLRRGDVGFNDAEKEKVYERRTENEWPIARTQYTRFYLTPSQSFTQVQPIIHHSQKLSYEALGSLENPKLLQFTTLPFEEETEVTGYIVAHLNVSVSPHANGPTPSDIDIFLTLRHISPEGKEVHYTGTVGDPVPLAKGWLRASLRKVDLTHPKHREYLPWRNYFNTEVEPIVPGEVYGLDVEVWPTTVVVERGGKIIFEVSSGDTQGCGIFHHNHPEDRSDATFAGLNHLHFGEKCVNYVTLPIVPPK
jgi:predicted acyl esterase